MNKSYKSLMLLAAAGALAFSSVAISADKLQVPASPSQQAQMKAEAAAAKAARAKMTPEEKKAADAQKQQELEALLNTCVQDYQAAHPSPEQVAKMKADAAAVKAARAKMTPAERKALTAEKQKQVQECLKAGG